MLYCSINGYNISTECIIRSFSEDISGIFFILTCMHMLPSSRLLRDPAPQLMSHAEADAAMCCANSRPELAYRNDVASGFEMLQVRIHMLL